MRKDVSLVRVILAFVAALLVAGPGLMVATAAAPIYKVPVAVAIVGPGQIFGGNTQAYTFKVKFSDGTTQAATVGATVEGGTLAFSKVAGAGSVSGDKISTGLVDIGLDIRVNATYTNPCGSATVNRTIKIVL
jgi:hypothetical protein